MPGTDTAVAPPGQLVGNRWMLVGGIVYLLEWVGIIGTSIVGLGSVVTRGATGDQLLESYGGHVDAAGFLAGWLAVVLLGRILVFVGLRRAMVDSGRTHPLLDLAVVAATVSVTLEVASYGLALGAAEAADAGDRAAMGVLDLAGTGLNLMIGGGLGVAVTAAAYVMWRSGWFSTTLNALGLVSGVAIVAAQLSVSPSLQVLFDILYFFPLVFWVWMVWAGVVLWRRTPSLPARER
jgi:hypothetical protein